MMLPEVLYKISVEQRQASDRGPTISAPGRAPSVDWPKLPQIAALRVHPGGRKAHLCRRWCIAPSRPPRERRHFAVLTGLSGTGKTLFAIEYAKAVTQHEESNDRICKIAIQPGWYDPTPLLGYVNPLGENRYTATEFLRFLIRAKEHPSQPHVCVLDEMNLSHPEQYLAPILSAMEIDGDEIELHGGEAVDDGIPPRILYPDNLVLIGTVNMDETTMRHLRQGAGPRLHAGVLDVDVDRWPGWEASPLGAG